MEKEEIVREFLKVQSRLQAFALSICNDLHMAEDITQEVAVKLVKRAGHYDDSKAFLPWALHITRCETVDYLRKYNRHNKLVFKEQILDDMENSFITVSAELAVDERLMAMRLCLRKLDSENFTLFKRKYADKVSVKTLAGEYQRSFLSMQSLLGRLREKLRRCIKRQLEAGL